MEHKVNQGGWLEKELEHGIAALRAGVEEVEREPAGEHRTFWLRYWQGYLRAYESLQDKLTAVPEGCAQEPPEPSEWR